MQVQIKLRWNLMGAFQFVAFANIPKAGTNGLSRCSPPQAE